MADRSTENADATVVSVIESARFVFGALVDDGPTLVECVDSEAFATQPAADMTLATAVTSITSDLIPLVIDVEEPTELPDIQTEADRLTDIDSVIDGVGQASAYYLLVNTVDDEWKRVRHAEGGTFTVDGEVTGPEDLRYQVASPLVDEARERIADLPESVDGESIQPVSWS